MTQLTFKTADLHQCHNSAAVSLCFGPDVVFNTYEESFLLSRRLLHELGELGQGSTGGSRSRDSS